MKKVAGIGIALALIMVMVSVALAIGPGAGMGPGMGCGMGHGMGPGACVTANAALTPEQAQKVEQFQKEIAPLREQMFTLRTEMRELRAQSNPDWKAIGDKQKAMIDLKTRVREQAEQAGIIGLGACGAGMGKMGMGAAGRGRMMGMGRTAL
ncbi:MAG: periplasmic heavy metal sensor [Nitrospirota bacterium]